MPFYRTLTFLINGEALINWEGGKFFKFNKRGGPNKRGGWNFFSNLINGEGRINGEGGIFFANLINGI